MQWARFRALCTIDQDQEVGVEIRGDRLLPLSCKRHWMVRLGCPALHWQTDSELVHSSRLVLEAETL